MNSHHRDQDAAQGLRFGLHVGAPRLISAALFLASTASRLAKSQNADQRGEVDHVAQVDHARSEIDVEAASGS
jgi:hypothetical protein